MNIRRLVTANRDDGRSDFAFDGFSKRVSVFENLPGFEATLLWAEPGAVNRKIDPAVNAESWLPEAGGSRVLVVSFPPDSVMREPGFDPVAAGAEYLEKLPGLAETFEPDGSGMHRTTTVDYGVVLQGEIWLELDDGRQKLLNQHDFVVQNGTRHAWRNKGSTPAIVLFVLIGKM